MNKMFKKIISIYNEYGGNCKFKVLKLFGIKIKFRVADYQKYGTLLRDIHFLINGQNFSSVQNGTSAETKERFKDFALLFKYDYFGCDNKCGVNIGDYVQTIATKNVIEQIFPKINYKFWDRDNLLYYNGDPAFTVMQGWFAYNDSYLPNDKILPVFIGMHLALLKREGFINFLKYNPRYFDNITFGCRDKSTYDFIKQLNLPCYLSRCLTLTFPKRKRAETQNTVYIVDIPDKYLKYIPKNVLKNAKIIHQRQIDRNQETAFYINSENKYMQKAEELLSEYRDNAKLVITSALHCASPCIAMGIPTILIDLKGNNERFGSLDGVTKIYTKEDLINGKIDYNQASLDIEDLKQLIIKNVSLSIKQAFGENIVLEELNFTRKQIENYKTKSIVL